jgi:hypothetical protein
VRRPLRIGDGNVWRYRPCITKVWFSDIAHFPSFSTLSAMNGHSAQRRKKKAPQPDGELAAQILTAIATI